MGFLLKNSDMIRKCRMIVSAVVLTALVFVLFGMRSYATGQEEGADPGSPDAVVAGRRTTEEGVYIYIRNAGALSGEPVVQIGNTVCEDVEVLDSVDIRTLVLLDNSRSVYARWGTESIDLIKGMIMSPAEREQIKLATFADGLTVWEDYSGDLPTLLNIAELIPFEDQDSFLTDILYELLQTEADSEEACYSRFVLITDGADDNEITYTQEELKELLRGSGVAVYTLGVNTENNSSELERLFSYARLTNGDHSMVGKGDTPEAFLDLLKRDRYLLGIRVVPGRELQDGSTKEAKITIPTEDGEIVLKTSLQMPFAAPEEAVETVEVPTPEIQQPTPAAEPESVPAEPQEGETADPETGTAFPWIAVIALGAVLLIILIVIIVLLVSHKKKQERSRRAIRYLADPKERKTPAPQAAEEKAAPVKAPANAGEDRANRTISLFDTRNTEDAAEEEDGTGTISLFGKGGRVEEAPVKHFYVILKDMNEDREFRAEIGDRIVIGRSKDADIALDFDRAVSGKHCQIEKRGDSCYITDLGSSNGTECEGRTIKGETLLHEGDTLVLGHGKYRVGFEEK